MFPEDIFQGMETNVNQSLVSVLESVENTTASLIHTKEQCFSQMGSLLKQTLNQVVTLANSKDDVTFWSTLDKMPRTIKSLLLQLNTTCYAVQQSRFQGVLDLIIGASFQLDQVSQSSGMMCQGLLGDQLDHGQVLNLVNMVKKVYSSSKAALKDKVESGLQKLAIRHKNLVESLKTGLNADLNEMGRKIPASRIQLVVDRVRSGLGTDLHEVNFGDSSALENQVRSRVDNLEKKGDHLIVSLKQCVEGEVATTLSYPTLSPVTWEAVDYTEAPPILPYVGNIGTKILEIENKI